MDYQELLSKYSLEEILEINDITEEDLLEYLVLQDYIVLPI